MFSILKAKEQDLKAISALANIIWAEHFVPIIGEEQVVYMLEKFQSTEALKNQVNKDGYTYFKLLEDESLVGFMGVVFDKDKTYLSKLYLSKETRGKGYASKSLQYLMDACEKINCHTIWLTCNKNNANTIKIYEKMGFEIFDDVVSDIGNGFVMDDYYFKKTF